MSDRRNYERGFTLVELLVSMVLGAIVLALVVGAIINMFGASERSSMRSKAQRATVNASEQLTSDLRAMRAPERDPFHTGSADNLRNLILFQRNPTNLLIHDILEATGSRLVFYAELVNTSARAECVTWSVEPDGSLLRTVRSFSPNCTTAGVTLQSTQVMPTPERTRASASASVPAPFSYRVLVHPANTTTVRPDDCVATTRTSLDTPLARNQATAVELNLRSFVAGKVARGDQELITAVSISSRQAQEYRFAIGCVA